MSDPVLDLLNKKDIKFTISGRDYLIKCLNPEHDDSNPSCRVDKITGATHCFSCGFKANIFKYYGVLTSFTSIKVAKLKDKLGSLKVEFEGQDLPLGYTQFNRMFRGISAETLREFGAFTTFQVEKLQDRICFPIKDIRGKTAVYQARHMLSDAQPKYINYPNGVELPLYPVKYKGSFHSAVLVEGIFDMLNLYDKGLINVTCTFGTNTLQKDTAVKLLPLRTQGISHLYLLFDGDKAGVSAAEKLKPLLEEHEFIVEIIRLPDELDPGSLDQEYVDSINEYVNKNENIIQS